MGSSLNLSATLQQVSKSMYINAEQNLEIRFLLFLEKWQNLATPCSKTKEDGPTFTNLQQIEKISQIFPPRLI